MAQADMGRESVPLGMRSWLRCRVARWIVGASALLLVPAFTIEPYHITICVNLYITLMLTLSLNFVVGLSGQWSFAHAAFFGLGAYVPAILTTRLGLSPWLGLPAGVGAALALAMGVGIPIVRLRGYYLAVCTLALGFLGEVVVRQATEITGGGYGIQRIPPLEVLGVPLRGARYYPVALAAMLVCAVLIANLVRSPLGRAIRATRDNPMAASATGINVGHTRLLAFVIAASIAAAAGWVHCFYYLGLDPSLLSSDQTFLWIFMVFIGGVGHTTGVILGTILLVLAPELLGFATQNRVLAVGVLMLVVAFVAPRGLGGLLDAARGWASKALKRQCRKP
jgi:branched-chain amino acid transport system permease protein